MSTPDRHDHERHDEPEQEQRAGRREASPDRASIRARSRRSSGYSSLQLMNKPPYSVVQLPLARTGSSRGCRQLLG